MAVAYKGIVKGGVVVLEGGVALPEGAEVKVEILGAALAFSSEEAEEFAAWERASDAAWAIIGQEEESKPDASR